MGLHFGMCGYFVFLAGSFLENTAQNVVCWYSHIILFSSSFSLSLKT